MFCTLLAIGLFGCNQESAESGPQESSSSICECINSVQLDLRPEESLNANMACLLNAAKNNRDTFQLYLNNAFLNCTGFARRISELELSAADLDTLQFVRPKPDYCLNNLNGAWYDVLGDASSYSITYEDKVEHYEDDILVGNWLVISKSDCEITYVVAEQNDESFPPYVGDTVVSTLVGIKDSLVKNVLQIRGFEVVSIGVKRH
jgi:hypothetical protein